MKVLHRKIRRHLQRFDDPAIAIVPYCEHRMFQRGDDEIPTEIADRVGVVIVPVPSGSEFFANRPASGPEAATLSQSDLAFFIIALPSRIACRSPREVRRDGPAMSGSHARHSWGRRPAVNKNGSSYN